MNIWIQGGYCRDCDKNLCLVITLCDRKITPLIIGEHRI